MAVILLIWLPLTMFSQNKPYLLFTKDEGLANNGVKSITKDQDGMLWLGTENGISKYDGQKFLNIRKSDGLPGNRVWAIASDHKGKIYAGCYHDGLAVIENNRVTKTYHIKSRFPDSIRRLYYSDNFQMLFVGTDFGIFVFKDSTFFEIPYQKESTCKSSVLNMVEVKGQIYFSTHSTSNISTNGLLKLSVNRENPLLSTIENIKKDKGNRYSLTSLNDTLYSANGSEVITYPISNFNDNETIANANGHFMPWVSCAIGKNEILMGGFNNGTSVGGLQILNTVSGKLEKTQYRIGNQTINDLFYDTETEIIWVCSDNGLISLRVTLFELKELRDKDVLIDIAQQDNLIYLLSNDEVSIYNGKEIVGKFTKNEIAKTIDKFRNKIPLYDRAKYHRIFEPIPFLIIQFTNSNNKLFLTTSLGSVSIPDLKEYLPFYTKNFILDDKGGAYFVPDYEKLRHFPSVLKPQFSIIKGDQTNISYILKIIRVKELFLFASFYNGLYAIKDDKVYYLNESNSDLNNYLTSIDTNSAGEIWCTSIEGNLFNIGFDNDLFIKRKLNNQNSGIVGDVCKWLKFNNKNLYLGTNKGLNIIPIAELEKEKVDSVQFFNKENGYDFVSANNPFTDNEGNIYVRAQNQLIKISNISVPKSPAKISVEDIRLNNNSVGFEMLADKTLPSSTEGIKLKFLLVKFPGSKNTSYRYRVNAGNWNEGGNLNFEAVKAGSYVVDLEAKDIETGRIYLKTVRFQISTPLLQRWWFILLITTICLSIAWVIFKIRMNLVNKQHQEKYRLLRENSELQIRSLQVQMNPHFIFNILNSIQSLIMQSKIKDALQYLGSLGSIIRMNLENVSEEYIPLEEEIRFLKKYIEIEELRFKKKFQIELQNEIPEMNILVPPMLIQPIIENAIKHGVRGLNDGGLVTVSFTVENENLVVTVEDNGIGRIASNKTKIERHQSKGQELIEKRLNLLNEKNKTKANSITITDLEENGQASGTKVIVTLELLWAT